MLEMLTDNLLIICPNSYKLAILKYLNDNKLILDIKFMTMSEYRKCIKFDYNIDTIYYLVNKNMKVENAITILDNLYYIDDKKYNNEKLDYLVNIKKELDNNNLLIYDNLFSKILKRRKVVVYGYGLLNSFNKKLFNEALIVPYEKKDKKYDIYHFGNIRDEVEFVFQRICDLLKNNVDINNISLMNIDNEYIPFIKMMESFYDIKVNVENTNNLMGTVIGKKFYELILNNKNINEIISELETYKNNEEYNAIIDILNKYSDYNLLEYSSLIKYELLNHKVSNKLIDNMIKVKEVFDYVSDDEYVFLLNFNNPCIPKLKMDTDYITNDISSLVGLETIEEENELIKENTINYLVLII